MPFPNFKLCHGLVPDGCRLTREQLFSECEAALKAIEEKLTWVCRLSGCVSSSAENRRCVLTQFDLTEHEENNQVLVRGIYILFEGYEPTMEQAFYVGVANDVPKRLASHLRCTGPETSSLIYLLLKRHLPDAALWIADERTGRVRKKRRKELFKEYKAKCQEIRDHLVDQCSVLIHPVPDVMTLHVLEALLSLELKTGPWNSFKPH